MLKSRCLIALIVPGPLLAQLVDFNRTADSGRTPSTNVCSESEILRTADPSNDETVADHAELNTGPCPARMSCPSRC
jgi:hypothetical protein